MFGETQASSRVRLTEQNLDAEIETGFEKMCSEGMLTNADAPV